MTRAEGTPRTRPAPYFEDFRVGQRYTGPARTFSRGVVAAFAEVTGDTHPLHTDGIVLGALVLSAFFGWHHELGLSTHVEAAFDVQWEYRAPVHVGDTVTYEMTITRCRRTSGRTNGVVGRHIVVRDQNGVVVQAGTSSMLVTARMAADDQDLRTGRAFVTEAWAAALAERLNQDPDFRTATSTWDGTIGLRSGAQEIHFRVYQGRVHDTGPRTPNGPRFVLAADDLTWTELLTGPVNDFTKRAMKDEFRVHGDAYEYLRLTKALIALVGQARVLAGEEESMRCAPTT
ncbi:MaoC/PaaZ C-terminal domain-containing protein [Acrocarpospora catenulata]|uniref:MaoC/PaaZ C-terminal domain-containing protein n=1 Tax=Acrocarpospora catenulata TaxID=2836182 RepID=UPI001BDA1274|nr:MaoC/PaaZ C-terminal domain-containing protein [Acrocarpospora catenulata]